MNLQTHNQQVNTSPSKAVKTRTPKSMIGGQDEQSINRIDVLIESEMKKLAIALEISLELLQEWFSDNEGTKRADKKVILALLQLGIHYRLNPLHHEIALITYEDGQWQAIVTMDGLYKLINREPTFSGMTFSESSEKNDGVPIWMECAIYRSDRTNPVIIKEYFEEVKNSLDSWEKMPRRMLRHRTLQQCARAAFGFTGLATHFENNSEPKLISQAKKLDCDLKPKMQLTRSEELKGSLLGISNNSSKAIDEISVPMPPNK